MFVPTAIHIRHVLIYLFLSHTTMKDSETFLKNVYNTHAPHYNTIRNWFHRFEKDDFSLDEKDRSGRPREKSQWVGEGESPQDVPNPDLHPKKVMLSVWWGVDGPIYWELLPEGKTITGDLYTTQLRNLKKAVDRSALKDKKVYYQHDNARPHVSKQVKQELMGYGWNVLPHPPYSPDLAPSDYWLFGDMTRAFKGRSFNSRGAVEAALKQYFASRPAGFYRNGIHKLRKRWRHVVDNDGQYN
ncbi:unnamed protein product [Caenorhabditis nigoni]